MKKIVTVPYPTLRQVAKEIVKFDKETRRLVEELWEALQKSTVPGVGIAAPQIGESKRIFILRKEKGDYEVFINPVITKQSKVVTTGLTEDNKEFLEGCLSIPNFYGAVGRPDEIEIEWYDLKGKQHKRTFREPFSRYAQHEQDHLNGILFTDHVIAQKRKLYVVNEDDELEEVNFDTMI